MGDWRGNWKPFDLNQTAAIEKMTPPWDFDGHTEKRRGEEDDSFQFKAHTAHFERLLTIERREQ